jgi:DUF4097 and DUF4098 domain-containing protein YvlB
MSEQQFDTPGPVQLEVAVASGDIQIATVEGQQSTVTLEGSQKLVDATRVELVGDRLAIQQRRKSVLSFLERWDDPLHVRVTIPLTSSVEVTTASADATLEGSFRDVAIKSASGSLRVSGEIAGAARAQTVSGDVRLPRVAGDLAVKTVSGDLEADAVEGSVEAQSVSGDVRVGSVREGSVAVQSVSGDVRLGIAEGTSIDVDAGSASGDLSSEVPLSDAPGEESGPTVVIRSKTVSGDVRLFRAA